MPDVITVIEDVFALMVAAFASPQGLKVLADIRALVEGKAAQMPLPQAFNPNSTQPLPPIEEARAAAQPLYAAVSRARADLPPIEEARAAAQHGWQATAVNPPAQDVQSKWSAG